VPTVDTADNTADKNDDGNVTLLHEIVEVEHAVLASLADLHRPFAQLVEGQWRRNYPLVRAAFVLTAGTSGRGETAEVRRRRIYLAAAMETLRLALGVHTQLLLAETPADLDRSLLGSTVLAGDFCFSRSAGLAAKTGSPVIVDLFASALQHVSEGSLRRLFRPSEPPYDEDRELCLSGIAAANELTGLPPHARALDQQLGARLLDAYRSGLSLSTDAAAEFAYIAADRRPQWRALVAWLLVHPLA
jgi:hypothetical protein